MCKIGGGGGGQICYTKLVRPIGHPNMIFVNKTFQSPIPRHDLQPLLKESHA